MWTLIIVNLVSGGFATTTLHDFSSQAQCESAKTAVTTMNANLGTKPGVFEISCVAK